MIATTLQRGRVNPDFDNGYDLANKFNDLVDKVETLREEVAEAILFTEPEETLNPYNMTYEQQCELPYRSRL
jgi:hypothetical protein